MSLLSGIYSSLIAKPARQAMKALSNCKHILAAAAATVVLVATNLLIFCRCKKKPPPQLTDNPIATSEVRLNNMVLTNTGQSIVLLCTQVPANMQLLQGPFTA
jgi:hypothetical protein